MGVDLEKLFKKYDEVEGSLEGVWFALDLEALEVIVVAETNKELNVRLRGLGKKSVLVGYAPTREEREAPCLYVTLLG